MSMNDAPTLPDWAGNDKSVAAAGFDLDADKYIGHLDGLDMTDAQKTETLEILWSMMRSFVELGFRVDICAQLFEDFNSVSGDPPDGLDSSHSTTKETPFQGGDDGGSA